MHDYDFFAFSQCFGKKLDIPSLEALLLLRVPSKTPQNMSRFKIFHPMWVASPLGDTQQSENL